MLNALCNREWGQESHRHFPRWCSTRFCKNIDISFKTFEKIVQTNITCIDLDNVDCKYTLVGHGNGCILIYDVERIEHSAVYPSVATIDHSVIGAHKFSVDCVQWYPHDTGMFMSLSADKSLKVWDTNELEVAETFRFSHDVYSFDMSEKARRHSTVAVGCKDSNIYMCDLKTGSKSHTLKGHTGPIFTIKWSTRNDNILCSGSSNGHVYMWDFRKVKSYLASFVSHTIMPNERKTAHQGSITSLCYSNNGLNLLSYGGDGLKLWDVISECDTNVTFGQVNNTNRRTVQMAMTKHLKNDLVFVPSDVDIKVFDIMRGNDIGTLSGHFMKVNCCAFNSFKCEMYSGSADTRLLTWKHPQNVVGDISVFNDTWSDDE